MTTKAQKAKQAAEVAAENGIDNALNKTPDVVGSGEVEVLVIGKCAIRIGEVFAVEGASILLDESDLKLQAWKSLFVTKQVIFKDDSRRTEKFIASIRVKEIAPLDVGENEAKDDE